ncbi:MAG: hypothetical protein NTU53_15930 [Planctomycetota bacterium]|nr:hypothetical protein [Planctomycetota bacterium]
MATYVVSYDATRPFAEERYAITLGNLPAGVSKAKPYDPVADKEIPLKATRQGAEMSIEVPVVNTPRLLVLE